MATHFIMNRPIPKYYPYLGSKRYFKRLQATNDTLYYNTSARQLIFYNKLKEAKSKGVIIPEVYRNEYLLRYESKKGLPCPKVLFRLKKKLTVLANKPEISEQSELITELSKNIKSIKGYYR